MTGEGDRTIFRFLPLRTKGRREGIAAAGRGASGIIVVQTLPFVAQTVFQFMFPNVGQKRRLFPRRD